MTYLKKLGLMAAAVTFFVSVSAISSSAQTYRDRNWQNRGYYWQTNQNRRNRRLSAQEYRRLRWQRYRLYRMTNRYNNSGYYNNNRYYNTNRYYNNGYYSNGGYSNNWERRRLNRRYYQNNRTIYRVRRNW